jgi:hypothetical protein
MPLIVFDCKGITATRRERIQAAVEAGGRTSKSNTRDGLLPIPFVVECAWSSPAHMASSARCCSISAQIRLLSPHGSGRQSMSDVSSPFLTP